MDHFVLSFKEVCGPVWSTETIKKMIAKHGLDASIGIALDGGKPDVEVAPIEPIVILDDATPKMDDKDEQPLFQDAPQSVASPSEPVASVAEPVAESDSLEIVSVVLNNKDGSATQSTSELDKSVENGNPAPVLGNLAGSQKSTAVIEESSQDDPLRPDPFFSKMTILEDDDEDDHARAEMELSMVRNKSPTKKRKSSTSAEVGAPSAKRAVPKPVEEEEQTAPTLPVVPSLADAMPVAPGVPNPRAPTAVAMMSKWRQPTDEERAYLKTLTTPTRLCDLPPHDFGRMTALQTGANTANGPLLGNLLHWKAMQQAQLVTGHKWRKDVPAQRSEVMMIVDADFAFSEIGVAVMNELQKMDCPVTSAKLPCRNTIIWRRCDAEYKVKASVAEKPKQQRASLQQQDDMDDHDGDEDDRFGAPFAAGRGRRAADLVASHAIGPLTRFQYDLDHCLLILSPKQWAKAHFEDFQLPAIDEAKQVFPGKRLSVMILHSSANFKYPELSHSDVGLLNIQMQLRHELHHLMTENGGQPLRLAFTLSQFCKSLSIRPYEYLSRDGPFYSFDPESDPRTGSREHRATFIKMLQAAGTSENAANAISNVYKSPLALFQAFNAAPTPEIQRTMLKNTQTTEGSTIGLANASAAYEAFSAAAAHHLLYRPLRKQPK